MNELNKRVLVHREHYPKRLVEIIDFSLYLPLLAGVVATAVADDPVVRVCVTHITITTICHTSTIF